jgi:nucleotide-binding universal stress UspA family protein
MERILVGIDSRETDLAPGIHAVNLAKRIQAKVFFLLITQPGSQKPEAGEGGLVSRLERLIGHARSEGLPVEYFVSEGPFESETIRFIQENSVNLLVVGHPRDGGEASQKKFQRTLENIRLRVDCHIEVVNQRDQSMHTEGK